MKTFNDGDYVIYTGRHTPELIGKYGVVVERPETSERNIIVEFEGTKDGRYSPYGVFPENITLVDVNL